MQIFDLKGKTAIITGASSGLGEQFARCLSGAGARVILAARRIDKLNDLAAELNNARAIQMDVAVIHMAKSLVTELSRHKIRINSIAPGLFHTPMTDHKLANDQQRQEFAEQIPMGFVATPKDLDGALLLLASNAHSSYITGACITVDGGKSFGTSWGS